MSRYPKGSGKRPRNADGKQGRKDRESYGPRYLKSLQRDLGAELDLCRYVLEKDPENKYWNHMQTAAQKAFMKAMMRVPTKKMGEISLTLDCGAIVLDYYRELIRLKLGLTEEEANAKCEEGEHGGSREFLCMYHPGMMPETVKQLWNLYINPKRRF